MNIIDLLVKKKLIEEKSIASIRREVETSGLPVEQILLKHGISPEEILKSKGEYLEVPVRSLGGQDVAASVLDYVPEESAMHYKFVPLAVKEGVLEVGLVDPDNIEARDALTFISSKINMPYKAFLISEQDFEKVISTYKGLSGEVTKALSELETELVSEREAVAMTAGDEALPKSETKIIEDAPVTKIVATILRYATE